MNKFQRSMPVLGQERPISYTDLPGFAGQGTPLFRGSAARSGITKQLDTENGGNTANNDPLHTPGRSPLTLIGALVLLSMIF